MSQCADTLLCVSAYHNMKRCGPVQTRPHLLFAHSITHTLRHITFSDHTCLTIGDFFVTLLIDETDSGIRTCSSRHATPVVELHTRE